MQDDHVDHYDIIKYSKTAFKMPSGPANYYKSAHKQVGKDPYSINQHTCSGNVTLYVNMSHLDPLGIGQNLFKTANESITLIITPKNLIAGTISH